MKHSSARSGFTLIELIFVIVIIGVLATIAIPRFTHLTDNSKISSELATASSVQGALDAIHSEWITNTCDFDWGNGKNTGNAGEALNANGYPDSLDDAKPFDRLFKTPSNDWSTIACPDGSANQCYRGPATNGGATDRNLPNKPEGNDYWKYDSSKGTLTLIDQ